MTAKRIALVALVDGDGAVLLRVRDERSVVRANRWSLVGGGVEAGETPAQAAARMVREQTGLTEAHDLRLAWRGSLPGVPVEAFLFAARTRASIRDIAMDVIPGALPRRGEYSYEFVPGAAVQSGRPFTLASGHVIGPFLDSRRYRELVSDLDVDEVA